MSLLTFVVGISVPFAGRVVPLACRVVVLLPVGLDPAILPSICFRQFAQFRQYINSPDNDEVISQTAKI